MKTKNFLFLSLLFYFLLISCDKKQLSDQTTETKNIIFDSTSSVNGIKNPNKKFIHKADINIEVKDALKSTLTIEKNVIKLGGYVGKSELNSQIISEKITPISKDSARETKVYNITNFMEVRIPKNNLNEFLQSLNQEIGFVISRNLEITDVTIEARINNIKTNTKKIDKNLNNSQEENLINKYKLNDLVQYATVTLDLVEKENIKQTIIPNTKNYTTYENSNFGYQIKTALYTGGNILQKIIIVILYIWPLWVILILGYIILRKYKKSKIK